MSNDFKPTLLLHVCCASCAAYVIESLRDDFEITVFFYDLNIHPLEEYLRRIADVVRFCKSQKIPFLEGEYDVSHWLDKIKGHENDREGGQRCEICFRMRLEKTASVAQDFAFDFFTTTLTISPHKNASVINQIGKELRQDYGVNFYEADFKKNDAFKKSCLLAKQWRFYRQDYCGCIFSKRERDKKLKQKKRIKVKKVH